MAVRDAASVENARQALLEAQEQEEFWREHFSELLEKYADQFVAVRKKEVIAASPDLQHLLGILEGKGLDIQDMWVRFITADPHRLML